MVWHLNAMPNYRRDKTKGGTWFFTACLKRRGDDLLTREIDRLRSAVVATMASQPFQAVAWVVLPDHMHCIWSLPDGDADYPNRWKALKGRFSRSLPNDPTVLRHAVRPREKGVWQNRYWEHRIRDNRDLRAHLRYIHTNPVKHGLATSPRDWPFSSVHQARYKDESWIS